MASLLASSPSNARYFFCLAASNGEKATNDKSHTSNEKNNSILNHGGFKALEREVGSETAPSPPHPAGCEGSCAPDRHLNAPPGAAGQARDLKTESTQISESGCREDV